MFTTEKIIGDVVYISFADKERYKDIGIDKLAGHFKILGYDNIGLWVEHPYMLESKSTNKKIKSNFVIKWDNVKTIMHYPGRKGYDFPSEFDKNIGFIIRKKIK